VRERKPERGLGSILSISLNNKNKGLEKGGGEGRGLLKGHTPQS